MRVLSALLAVPVVCLAAACGTSSAPRDESTGKNAAPIINGVVDVVDDAVVAIAVGNQGLCSGTIVKVDAATHIGWVLTAAHCVEVAPVLAIQGSDFNDISALQYSVVDYTQDTRYVQADKGGQPDQPYDFAVIRIAGVDASTAVIPIPTSSDGVSVGSAVKQVGFGKTIPNGPSGVDTNTNRRSITAHVNQMNSVSLAYSLPNDNGGVCQGDSGGPDIFSGKVVGVHSYGDVNCQQYAASGRVTGDLAYIQGELAKPSPAKDCSLCEKIAISGKSQCALTSTCLADKDCGGFYNCFQDCAQTGSAAACRDQCLKKFPKAEGPLIASDACACDRACPTECKGNILCAGVPKCGYKFPAGACTTCTESTCCQESLDCGEDGTCYLCLKNKDKDPACATNAKRKALANCVASKCNTQCAGSGVQNGADPSATDDGGAPEDPGADPGGTTTTTTEGGCSASSSAPSSLAPIALALAALVAMRRRRDAR